MNAQGLTLDSRIIVINSESFGKGFLATFNFIRSLIDPCALQLEDSFHAERWLLKVVMTDRQRFESSIYHRLRTDFIDDLLHVVDALLRDVLSSGGIVEDFNRNPSVVV